MNKLIFIIIYCIILIKINARMIKTIIPIVKPNTIFNKCIDNNNNNNFEFITNKNFTFCKKELFKYNNFYSNKFINECITNINNFNKFKIKIINCINKEYNIFMISVFICCLFFILFPLIF